MDRRGEGTGTGRRAERRWMCCESSETQPGQGLCLRESARRDEKGREKENVHERESDIKGLSDDGISCGGVTV